VAPVLELGFRLVARVSSGSRGGTWLQSSGKECPVAPVLELGFRLVARVSSVSRAGARLPSSGKSVQWLP
jgi:hypothetical protein